MTPAPSATAASAAPAFSLDASGDRTPVSNRMRPARPARSATARSTTTSRNGASSVLTRSLAVLPANSSARVTIE